MMWKYLNLVLVLGLTALLIVACGQPAAPAEEAAEENGG